MGFKVMNLGLRLGHVGSRVWGLGAEGLRFEGLLSAICFGIGIESQFLGRVLMLSEWELIIWEPEKVLQQRYYNNTGEPDGEHGK